MRISLGVIFLLAAVSGVAAGFGTAYLLENSGSENTQETPVSTDQSSTNTEDSKKSLPAIKDGKVRLEVPFTSQAPFADWDDPRQDNGCEEAVALMAIKWARREPLTAEEAEETIIAISNFEQDKYGEFRDTSVADTVQWIFRDYFSYGRVDARYNIGPDDIIEELERGNLVIVPVDGTKLGNPHFVPPGPEQHKLVVRGYDYKKQEFIVNDPGTRYGEEYRYAKNVLASALRDYRTGYNEPIYENRTAMIVVSR